MKPKRPTMIRRSTKPIPRESPKTKAKRIAGGKSGYSTIATRGTALKKRNPEKQAKAAKRQRAKHSAYMKSETRKAVDERAHGQCEAWLTALDTDTTIRNVVAKRPGAAAMDSMHPGGAHRLYTMRCLETERLHHHHLTYARYGGDELPEDVLKCCKRCHDFLESLKPAGNRFARSRS